jgi:hypothetical protein
MFSKEAEPPSNAVNFLDIIIDITHNDEIKTKTFKWRPCTWLPLPPLSLLGTPATRSPKRSNLQLTAPLLYLLVEIIAI